MTLQDTRTPQQMMQDFYGQANVNVPHYNGRYQEEQKNKRMASEVFFPTFNQPFGGGSQRPSDGSFGIEDTPLNRQAFPEAFGSRFGVASHDKPFSKYPPAVGGSDGRWPGMSTDDIKRYVYPSDNLLNIPITPFGMQAGGPSLFPIKKDLPGEVKGTIRGVQGGSRNDFSKPYGGLRKAGMLFANEGLFSA